MPLRQLYPDPNGGGGETNSRVDIIAVHGLNPRSKNDAAHAWDTWRKPSGPKGVLWLRDYLPEHVPDSRIFLYEYNSTAVYGNDRGTFIDKANEFLEAIRTNRGEDESRPIILLGHSLGGLLIEQSLVNAHNNPKYEAIKEATTGLAFFGTPHTGGNKTLVNIGGFAAKIATGLGFQKGDDVLETLKDGSIFTDILQEHWRHQLLRYNIVSFWGSTDTIVPRESSRFGLPGDRENIVKLNADHSGICRFDNSEPDQDNFKLVWNNVKDLHTCALRIVLKKKENADRESIYLQAQNRIEEKLDRLLAKVRSGKTTMSLSSKSVESLSTGDKELWRQFRKDLDSVGITKLEIAEHRAFIVECVKRTVKAGVIEDENLGFLEYRQEESAEDNTTTESCAFGQEERELRGETFSYRSDQPPERRIRLVENTRGHTNKRHDQVRMRPWLMDAEGSEREVLYGVEFKPHGQDSSLMERSSEQSDGLTKYSSLLEKLQTIDKESNNDLVQAAKNGDLANITRNIAHYRGIINKGDSSGKLAMTSAIARCHIKVVECFLENGADVNSDDADGWTILRWAVELENEEIVRLLIDKNVDLEARDTNGRTVLHCAARKGFNAVVKLLLEKGANPNAVDGGKFSAIHLAAWNGHSIVIQLLVENGANLWQIDWWGDTALSLAVRAGDEDITRLLLEYATRSRPPSSLMIDFEDGSDEKTMFLGLHNPLDPHSTNGLSLGEISRDDLLRLIHQKVKQDQFIDCLLGNHFEDIYR